MNITYTIHQSGIYYNLDNGVILNFVTSRNDREQYAKQVINFFSSVSDERLNKEYNYYINLTGNQITYDDYIHKRIMQATRLFHIRNLTAELIFKEVS